MLSFYLTCFLLLTLVVFVSVIYSCIKVSPPYTSASTFFLLFPACCKDHFQYLSVAQVGMWGYTILSHHSPLALVASQTGGGTLSVQPCSHWQP